MSEPVKLQANLRDSIAEVFGEETVIVQLQTGRYYALDGLASEIWSALAGGRGLDGATEAYARSADVDVEAARGVTAGFVRRLVEEELVHGEAPSAAVELDADAPVPGLEVFTDMSELLAADPIHDIDLDGTGWPAAPAPPSA